MCSQTGGTELFIQQKGEKKDLYVGGEGISSHKLHPGKKKIMIQVIVISY